MTSRLTLAIGLIVICVGGIFAQKTQPSSLTSLVETERAFAAMSPEKGMKAAFLAYLADDGILFRQGPVNGKELWQKRPDTSSMKLEWEPIFADIAASGDVGYTTGPWILTPGPNLDQPPAHGFFVSVWKKQKDGKWKLSVDLGIGHEHPEKVDRTFSTPETEAATASKHRNTRAEQARLMKLEKKLSQLAKIGSASAFEELAGENLRLYRDGDVPSVNREQALTKLTSSNEKLTSRVEKCFVAPSCDLAYTYGTYTSTSAQSAEAESGYYVRIWRKSGATDWKLVLDILNPPPPKK